MTLLLFVNSSFWLPLLLIGLETLVLRLVEEKGHYGCGR